MFVKKGEVMNEPFDFFQKISILHFGALLTAQHDSDTLHSEELKDYTVM